MIGPEDTIVAVASPPGRGSRALLRISGPGAVGYLRQLVDDATRLADVRGFSGRAVTLRAGPLRVPAWVTCFRAPRSYTREDLVEIALPASEPVTRAVARALVEQDGARLAGPGNAAALAEVEARRALYARKEFFVTIPEAGPSRP